MKGMKNKMRETDEDEKMKKERSIRKKKKKYREGKPVAE